MNTDKPSKPKIGQGTKVWQHVVILPDAVIGDECNICSHVFIENDVIIGNDVTIKNGSLLYDGVRLEDNVFVGPGVVFTNDRYPRQRNASDRDIVREPTLVKKGAAIGANSTIICGVVIGEYAMVGAGSVVTKDVPDHTKVYGNPAQEAGPAEHVLLFS